MASLTGSLVAKSISQIRSGNRDSQFINKSVRLYTKCRMTVFMPSQRAIGTFAIKCSTPGGSGVSTGSGPQINDIPTSVDSSSTVDNMDNLTADAAGDATTTTTTITDGSTEPPATTATPDTSTEPSAL